MAREVPGGISPPRFDDLTASPSTPDEWRTGVELLTPMFGGGVEPGEVDPVTPVSAKAIRGHLRHWWRIFCGDTLENTTGLNPTELMFARETEIFGSSDIGSAFDVVISDFKGLTIVNKAEYNRASYALFSDADTLCRPGLKFTVRIAWTKQFAARTATLLRNRSKSNRTRQKQGRPALPTPQPLDLLQEQLSIARWAWLNFGGVGGRTRRGLGVLRVTDKGASHFSLEERGSFRHRLPNDPVSIEVLRGATTGGDAVEAWYRALELYRDFRQSFRGRARDKRVVKPDKDRKVERYYAQTLRDVAGQTRWPEPDSIREITDSRLAGQSVFLKDGDIVAADTPSAERVQYRNHSGRVTSGPVPAFPRAILGLPIVFHFADSPNRASAKANILDQQMDPKDTTLMRTNHDSVGERMASPVITRPIRIEGRWYPALIIVRTPQLDGLTATLKPTGTAIAHDQIVNPAFGVNPPMNGKASALDALVQYAVSKGFTRFPSGG